ncbi:MAG: hypothetical protein Q9174_004958 [Haloplaca sp. 1 TL-2023]
MSLFGWSVGDIAMAIGVIVKIAEAFHHAKDIDRRYAMSRSFLRGLVPVLKRIQQCVESRENDAHREEIMAQGLIIHDAYEAFAAHVNKRKDIVPPDGQEKGSRFRVARQRFLSALDEMQGKVEKLQARVVNAMAFIGPILAFEIKGKVDEIARSLNESFGDADIHQTQITTLLSAIHDQTSSLQIMSSDYKTQLNEAMDQTRQNNTQDMDAIKENIGRIEASQNDLTGSLQLLTQQIDQQVQESQATSSANAERWASLHQDAQKQSRSLDAAKDSTSHTIEQAHTALGGLADLSGDSRLGEMTSRVGGFSRLYNLVLDYFPQLEAKRSQDPASTSPEKNSYANRATHATTSPSRTPPSRSRPRLFDTEEVCAEQKMDTTGTIAARKNRYPRIEMSPDLQFPPPPRRISKDPTLATGTSRCVLVDRPHCPSSPPPLPQRRQAPIAISVIEGRNNARPSLPPRPLGMMSVGNAQANHSNKTKPPTSPPKSPFLRSWTAASSLQTPSSDSGFPRSTELSFSSPDPYTKDLVAQGPSTSTTTFSPPNALNMMGCNRTDNSLRFADVVLDDTRIHIVKARPPGGAEPAMPTEDSSDLGQKLSFAERRDIFEQARLPTKSPISQITNLHSLVSH